MPKPRRDDARREVVIFTDGEIGFEQRAVSHVLRGLFPNARLHMAGIGSSPNRLIQEWSDSGHDRLGSSRGRPRGRARPGIPKDLPVHQCSNCAEYPLDDQVMVRVDDILATANLGTELAVIRFAA